MKKALLPAMLFIILSVVLNATALNLISKSFGQNSPTILDFILICPLASALAYIPLTPAGLGVQETAYVLILQALNVHLEIALAFALVTRALFTGTDIFGLPKILSVGLKQNRKAPTNKLLVEK